MKPTMYASFALLFALLATACSFPKETAPSGTMSGGFGGLRQTVDGSDLEPFKASPTSSCDSSAPPISVSVHEGAILIKVAPYTHAEKVLTSLDRLDGSLNKYVEVGKLNADKPKFQLEYRPSSTGTYKVHVRWQVCGAAMQESTAIVSIDTPPVVRGVCPIDSDVWCEDDTHINRPGDFILD